MRDAELVVVRTFLNRIEAELAQSALEAGDIESIVSADDAGGLRPGLWMIPPLSRSSDLSARTDVGGQGLSRTRVPLVYSRHHRPSSRGRKGDHKEREAKDHEDNLVRCVAVRLHDGASGTDQSGLASFVSGIQDRRKSILRRYRRPGRVSHPNPAREHSDQF